MRIFTAHCTKITHVYDPVLSLILVVMAISVYKDIQVCEQKCLVDDTSRCLFVLLSSFRFLVFEYDMNMI